MEANRGGTGGEAGSSIALIDVVPWAHLRTGNHTNVHAHTHSQRFQGVKGLSLKPS